MFFFVLYYQKLKFLRFNKKMKRIAADCSSYFVIDFKKSLDW